MQTTNSTSTVGDAVYRSPSPTIDECRIAAVGRALARYNRRRTDRQRYHSKSATTVFALPLGLGEREAFSKWYTTNKEDLHALYDMTTSLANTLKVRTSQNLEYRRFVFFVYNNSSGYFDNAGLR